MSQLSLIAYQLPSRAFVAVPSTGNTTVGKTFHVGRTVTSAELASSAPTLSAAKMLEVLAQASNRIGLSSYGSSCFTIDLKYRLHEK